jgi:hypothetical protein
VIDSDAGEWDRVVGGAEETGLGSASRAVHIAVTKAIRISLQQPLYGLISHFAL